MHHKNASISNSKRTLTRNQSLSKEIEDIKKNPMKILELKIKWPNKKFNGWSHCYRWSPCVLDPGVPVTPYTPTFWALAPQHLIQSFYYRKSSNHRGREQERKTRTKKLHNSQKTINKKQ